MKPPLADRIRRGDPLPVWLDLPLRGLSLGQRAGMALRRLRRPVRLDAHIISFGNITAGGTGKTPAAIARARVELAGGKRVAVVSRGYRSKGKNSLAIALPGKRPHSFYAEMGDELALMAKLLPALTVIRCADRVAGCEAAIAHGFDTIILDDGFQSLRLARDENIVLLDATNPFGNGFLLPRGILREPPQALQRATSLILTHCDRAPSLEPLLQRLDSLAPQAPRRLTRHAPARLWRVCDGMPLALADLQGRGVLAVCAIAQPESFVRSLEETGAKVTGLRAFGDHAEIPPEVLEANVPVLVTEKDAVRLAADVPENVWALGIELEAWPPAKR